MNFKKTLSFLMIVLIILSVTGCGSKTQTVSVNLPISSNNNEKLFAYAIIRGKNSSDEVEKLSRQLRSEIKANFSRTVTMSYDETVKDVRDAYEILIGETNRSETSVAKKALESNRKNMDMDFIIKVVDYKIVIYSSNDNMLQKAIEYFAETYCKNDKTWADLHKDTELIYEAPVKYLSHSIAKVNLKKFAFVTPRTMEYVYGRVIEDINEFLNGNQGYQLDVLDERAEKVENEILVGNLDRPESKNVSVGGKQEYILKVVDGKLVIKAFDSASLGAALNYLYNLILDNTDKGTPLELASDYEYTGKFDPTEQDYAYVWGDEFDGRTINNNYWVDYANKPYGNVVGSVLGGSVIEKGRENSKISNGSACIYANKKNADFYNGCITTYDTMQYKYGIMEIKAKLPISPGCAAFWMNGAKLSTGAMTEYDLLENFGKVDSFASNIHNWCGSAYHTSLDVAEYKQKKKYTFSDKFAPSEDMSSDFHIYTMAWDEHKVSFAFDGKTYFSYSLDDNANSDIHRLPVYLILSCGMGSANYGVAATKESTDYCELLVDYVHLYQRSDISALYLRNDIPKYNNRQYIRQVAGVDVP